MKTILLLILGLILFASLCLIALVLIVGYLEDDR